MCRELSGEAVPADVSSTTLLEERRALIGELNHRVRNMLQVVIGLCNQTLHRSSDLKQFETAFIGRVQALARAYELLSRDGWEKVGVGDLLHSQLAPYVPRHRYSVSGAEVNLTADAALGFGMALYELVTNAAKYGALSEPEGHINVTWRTERQSKHEGADSADASAAPSCLILQWIERGGPQVSAPARQGFGLELIQRQLQYQLHGKVTMDFLPMGLHVTLSVPVSEAVPNSKSPNQTQ